MERLRTCGDLSARSAAWVGMRTLGEPDAPLLDAETSAGRSGQATDQSSVSCRPWRSYAAVMRAGAPS